MTRDEVIQRLRASQPRLEGLGIAHLALFGSVARDEAADGSDVDLLADFAADQRIGAFRFAAIASEVEKIVGSKIDLVSTPVRHARLAATIGRDRINVF